MGLKLWFVIFVAGMITYLIRLSFIIAIERLKLPHWFSRGLRYVPPAVFSAILVPEMAKWDGKPINITWSNPQIIAGCMAALVAWRTRNVGLTLVIGLVCFLVLQIWL